MLSLLYHGGWIRVMVSAFYFFLVFFSFSFSFWFFLCRCSFRLEAFSCRFLTPDNPSVPHNANSLVSLHTQITLSGWLSGYWTTVICIRAGNTQSCFGNAFLQQGNPHTDGQNTKRLHKCQVSKLPLSSHHSDTITVA